jgi:hypothetical protein
MSAYTSRLSDKAQELLKKEFSNYPILKAYESHRIYRDSIYDDEDIYHLIVITKDDINTYSYLSYLITDYEEDYSDVGAKCVTSKILVTLSRPVYGMTLMYLSLIAILAKKLEPHFEGSKNAEKIVIQTGTLGYPHILKLIEACVYEFEGRKYSYSDVEDLISYREQ